MRAADLLGTMASRPITVTHGGVRLVSLGHVGRTLMVLGAIYALVAIVVVLSVATVISAALHPAARFAAADSGKARWIVLAALVVLTPIVLLVPLVSGVASVIYWVRVRPRLMAVGRMPLYARSP